MMEVQEITDKQIKEANEWAKSVGVFTETQKMYYEDDLINTGITVLPKELLKIDQKYING